MSIITVNYNREAALSYAKKWAFGRNPNFYNYEKLGGDCTNFASQCIYAGSLTMNYSPVFGWFYRSANDRTASWTGVEYLYNFLVSNAGVGPFGEEAALEDLQIGDIIQLGRGNGEFYHSPVVVGFSDKDILVAAHSYDAYARPLSSYSFYDVRGIRIAGVRKNG